jgi:hypothetical protein
MIVKANFAASTRMTIQRITLELGDHFDLQLPDGRILNFEQTADDFSIVHKDTVVASLPTSEVAKIDG